MTSGGTSLATPRLTLREPQESDAAALLAYHLRNDERISRWEPRRSDEITAHERWIAWRIDEAAAGRARTWLAFDPSAPESVAGIVSLDAIMHAPESTAMVSYSIDGDYEGRGYAREAVLAVIGYAFDVLGVKSVSANYDPANARSGGLLARLGFVEIARTPTIPGFERHLRAQVLAVLQKPSA